MVRGRTLAAGEESSSLVVLRSPNASVEAKDAKIGTLLRSRNNRSVGRPFALLFRLYEPPRS
jgi:hypothetical protein